ncbi:MAG: hypothetical protein C0434_02540 [Xanthomonadaceae bacterium]|nr:hypothetical protein [Xanthomonadaceae bacterium]
MSRYQTPSPEAIASRLKAGYGQGHGKDYKPWFEATSIRSRGRLVRTVSTTTGCPMNLVSELEGSIQLLGDFDLTVSEQYEQVVLRPELTYPIARRLKVRHIRAWKGRHLLPMTTDLVFCFADNPRGNQIAVSVKYQSDLTGRRGRRTNGQLAVEEQYHRMEGRRYVVATEAHTPPLLMSNLRWLRESLRNGSSCVSDQRQADFEVAFQKRTRVDQTIGARIGSAAGRAHIGFDAGIDAFRRGVWFRRIPADLNHWLRLNCEIVAPRGPNQGVTFPWTH